MAGEAQATATHQECTALSASDFQAHRHELLEEPVEDHFAGEGLRGTEDAEQVQPGAARLLVFARGGSLPGQGLGEGKVRELLFE